MTSRRWLPVLALSLTAAACAAPAKAPEVAVDPAALKDTIQAREKEWSAAFLAGNGAAIAGLYTADAAQIQPVGDAYTGHEGIAKAEQAQLDTIAVTAREDVTEEVIPAGNFALEVGHYSYQATSKATKKPVASSGRYMVLWRRDTDGVWRLHRDIGSEAPPKVAASVAGKKA